MSKQQREKRVSEKPEGGRQRVQKARRDGGSRGPRSKNHEAKATRTATEESVVEARARRRLLQP
jgi:hypothetical protein